MQIRTVTREAASQWSETARIEGKDLGEVLDRAGVLLTPERLAAVRAICLDQIAQVLEETPTHSYTRGRDVTLSDFQSLLANAIRDSAAKELERSNRR